MPTSEKNNEKPLRGFSSRRQNGIHFVGLSSGGASIANSEIIGLDIGHVHTGMARASTVAKLAEPLVSIETARLIEELTSMINQGAGIIVVGLPRSLNGKDTAQTKWLRQFVGTAKAKLPKVHFYFQDEALTSLEARIKKLESKKHLDEHALAAAIILQDFLDNPEELRVAV
ncbi:TPA: hypothetical protein DIS56_00725 [Candidatus Saccharibacteria bacterium]|nr:MAG: hypothetical protein A3F05_02960 [Candidatus Saccharibacteria bacterium RIFCSPHIGHO2_12_FULL_47_17]OGL38229.1 MAG: hypothetical protein A3J32_00875 [Candidatus Saccharibacteria bacterium RIFCSPLOWO2_02_FULL_46_7]HCM51647.1 hypothetical protein [Candidatus Saccharibacteria bacterium]